AIADSRTSAMSTVPPSAESQVTFMNWSEQPYNHWSFKNTGVSPSLMVPRAGGIVSLPVKLNPDIADIEFEYDGRSYTVNDAMVGDDTDGYVVLKDGEIVYERYFEGFTEHDHHLWASSTKSLVGLAMGSLVEQGKIDVTDNVSEYIPELKGTYFGGRTVRDVLNMVSALDYSEDYENFTPGTVSTEYFRRLGFVPAFDLMATDPMQDDTPRGIIGFVPRFEKNPELEPRVKFEYHSPNVDVAGWIIARVSGQPLNVFMAEHVWSKIGAEHDAFFMADVAFNPIATGGFNTTLRDFARVGLVVLNDGYYNGTQIFPKAWIDDTFALTDAERGHTEQSTYGDKDANVYDSWLEGYKNYLWVHDSENEIGTFRGVFGQHLYINRRDQVVIATFSSAASASNADRPSNKPRLAAFDAIARQLAE
ncbi:MAG: serine hydrolase domain-containing protein, partial [Woeseiaceae bacterium]